MIEAVLWLVINLYHEARGEPVDAQIASVQVVCNRAGWELENVRGEILKSKQFTWTDDRRKIAEAKQLVREGMIPGKMKSLVSTVYRAINTPFYLVPNYDHYKGITSTSTWGCYPGGLSTTTFKKSGHIFCNKIDVVKPGQIPKYIIRNAKRREWRKKKESKREYRGC